MDALRNLSRRHFLNDCWTGCGAMALAALLDDKAMAAGARTDPMAPKPAHFPGKAKRVIFLNMSGGPSQLDMFVHKPKLNELHGKPVPKSIVGDQRYAFIKPDAPIRGSERKFSRHGQCGSELSELLPHLGKAVDDICLIHSTVTDLFNHAPAELFLNTGSGRPGRPSMGSWITWGLGSEARDLPGFVVLHSHSRGWNPGIQGGASCWSAGFLPSTYQGVVLRNQGDPVLFLSNPEGIDRNAQQRHIQAINQLNRHRLDVVGDPEISTRVSSFETAFEMQMTAPEACDITREPKHILDMYGARPGELSFANNVLLARRLLERGVRFINVYHKGWDHHGTDPNQSLITSNLDDICRDTDQASAALVLDLKQRGMLDDTLVIWGGEFGRTPMGQGQDPNNPNVFFGRDHHPNAYTIWMAGAGIKRGFTLGKTDDLGFHVVEDRVHMHDVQATILHQLGFDHTKLTYKYQGRDFRLTDVGGELIKKILV